MEFRLGLLAPLNDTVVFIIWFDYVDVVIIIKLSTNTGLAYTETFC